MSTINPSAGNSPGIYCCRRSCPCFNFHENPSFARTAASKRCAASDAKKRPGQRRGPPPKAPESVRLWFRKRSHWNLRPSLWQNGPPFKRCWSWILAFQGGSETTASIYSGNNNNNSHNHWRMQNIPFGDENGKILWILCWAHEHTPLVYGWSSWSKQKAPIVVNMNIYTWTRTHIIPYPIPLYWLVHRDPANYVLFHSPQKPAKEMLFSTCWLIPFVK